ncbi:hypothetical protein BH09VER1_BH09VER1_54870 [soil metagenome]
MGLRKRQAPINRRYGGVIRKSKNETKRNKNLLSTPDMSRARTYKLVEDTSTAIRQFDASSSAVDQCQVTASPDFTLYPLTQESRTATKLYAVMPAHARSAGSPVAQERNEMGSFAQTTKFFAPARRLGYDIRLDW